MIVIEIDGWSFAPEHVMTPTEAAEAFKVDPKTIYTWARCGRLASIRTPTGHRRYSRQQVEHLLRGESW